MTTVMTAANFVGRPLGGWLAGRVGARAVVMACMFVHAVSLLALAYGTSVVIIVAFAIANGLAGGARVPVVVTMRADYFGAKAFGAILGLSTSVVTVASVAAPLLAGLSYDLTGSYTVGFTALAVAAAFGSLFMIFLPTPTKAPPSRQLEPAASG
jgi:MFS family permease